MATQQSQYLESKVLTAPTYRLHLMLIDGALRFGRQAEALLRQGNAVQAAEPLLRVIDILGELLAAVRERKTDVNKKLVGLYWFLFRRVSEAKLNSDVDKLGEALRLLEYERQTWLAVCEKFESGAESKAQPAKQKPQPQSPGLSLQA